MAEYTSSLANQMKMRDRDMVPRFLVVTMFGLMLATLAMVSFAKITDQPMRGVPAVSEVVKEMPITLIGARSGGVVVEDATGKEVAWSFKNKAGFIDVIWVSVSRERKVQGVTGNPPLRLVRQANGHTVIIDPATGLTIELIGYGPDNIAAFARLLD
jgi:putative photosynthetic complex assembly protein